MIHLVAEVGTVWNGDLTLAKELIAKASQVKCDAVKFQLFQDEQIKDSPHYDKLKTMILSEETLLELKEKAELEGVDWFASAMYPEAVDLLKKLGCKFFKIREKDSQNIELIEKALKTGMFVLVSTTKLPMEPSLLFHPRIRWLHVVPRYPPREDELHLSQVLAYRGLSDHYPSISSALASAAIILHEYGVHYEFIIEKHVVPEHDSKYVDDAVSITFDEFANLVKYVRQLEKMSWEATDKKIPVI